MRTNEKIFWGYVLLAGVMVLVLTRSVKTEEKAEQKPVPVIYNLKYSQQMIQGIVRLAYVTGHSDGTRCRNEALGRSYSYDDYVKDRSRDSLVYEQDVVSQLFK